ncbi:hypothetical protein D9756_002516 [Leucocoprinus leucothites]|uniref:Transcriptional regulator of RNA polII, SAGA, subunit-domain-containing protein n=1 Tax=Leucocoprinus leucothites TaxID=201217 RepID=A0A8H5LLR4_9AGAR|nr:hypothetical protein D9756_002516 [Leucoagaricus leucothites]
MSLSSTSTIKQQITNALGPEKSPTYFSSLQSFVKGQVSRAEFENVVCTLLDVPSLVQLHNALIISLFDATAVLKRPQTPPPPPAPKAPPKKRRRILLPYQGSGTPDDTRTFKSARMKRWALAIGRKERERVRNLNATVPQQEIVSRPRKECDEIARERGVILLPERGDPPGSRLAVNLHSVTRAPTIQHIADRMNLICAQNNLGAPGQKVPELMNLAYQAKLKQLITRALTLTSSSHAITSITPSSASQALHTSQTHHHQPQRAPVLTPTSFQTLFAISPADLPNKSATAMRLATMAHSADDDDSDDFMLKDTELSDQHRQIMALLGERSTVRESLHAAP